MGIKIEKIENYLQGRFNWLNLPRDTTVSPKMQLRSKSMAQTKHRPNYNYVVDLTEKPQDPG